MTAKDQQIADLQRELALTRVDFSNRLKRLELKVSALADGNDVVAKQQFDDTAQPKPVISAVPFGQAPETKQTLHTAKKPSSIIPIFKQASSHALSLLSPISKFVSPLVHLYQHYQAKGQGPIFVFILIGIALLVGGFGYLAQLLISELGAGSKTLMLFLVAVAVMVGGVLLAKRDKYPEISSAIISLGLLLNFVTVYVAGSFYQLLPDWIVLLSYFAIACTGFVLANKFDAKIVSTLALVGGGAIPLISQLDHLGTSYYLIGLAFIVVASLYQAVTKKWYWLGFINIFVAYSCIEFLLLTTSSSSFLGFFSQGFYCLFLLYICQLLAKQSQYSKDLIVLTVFNVFANIGIFYQCGFDNLWILPAIALVNVAISSVLLLKARKTKSYTVSLHTLLASTWLIIAIISTLAPDYWGFAIGLEGLFILYFALKENYFSVRIEAYGLLAFAILHAVFAVLPYFPDPALHSVKGIAVVASIGVLLFCSRKLFARFPSDIDWEVKLSRLFRPAESIWLNVFVLSLLWVQFGVWSAIFILPLQVLLFVKTHRSTCVTSEVMAYLGGAAIFGICLLGIDEVQSLSFRDLPNFAKVALLLVFAECWLFAEFYRRSGRTGPLVKLAEILRLGFYLILPLTFLPSVIKHYWEYSAIAIWASAMVAYVLGRVIRHSFIRTESLILFAVGVLYNLGFIIDLYPNYPAQSYIASLFGLCIFGYFVFQNHQRHVALLDKKIASLGLFFLAGCIAIYSYKWTNLNWAGLLTSSYIFALALYSQRHAILTRNRATLGYLCYSSVFASWFAIFITSGSAIISASIWVALSLGISLTFLIRAHTLNQLSLKIFTDSKTGYTLQHVLLALSGTLLLSEWGLALLISPWLILQGSYLFFTIKHSKFIAKLALGFIFIGLLKLGFIDAANALLWQKVALMIGIGLFMLATAFIYQKRLSGSIADQATP